MDRDASAQMFLAIVALDCKMSEAFICEASRCCNAIHSNKRQNCLTLAKLANFRSPLVTCHSSKPPTVSVHSRTIPTCNSWISFPPSRPLISVQGAVSMAQLCSEERVVPGLEEPPAGWACR